MALRTTRYIPDHLSRATQIQLSRIPITAKPTDIRRLVARAQAPGVEDVAIEYRQLEPTGRAFLKLTHTSLLMPCLTALESVSIAGVHPLAEPSDRKASRSTFSGLSSELGSDGKHAVVEGIPSGAGGGHTVLEQLLASMHFRRPHTNERYVEKLASRTQAIHRFLVRLASPAEAQRLVRLVHMTHYLPSLYGTKYPLRARVIY
ncbi:hypothetical protein MIND_01042600 [Mycena indigotica]|uniref:Uncharacterized protein n=1 Tax=Mycena indigotica TaxID=2126181 RepID=A0A8H6W0M7_9AGAR|nr:uncharacterized protein MIND_01042600 [Mycena indigotica]KAF7295044.1 hypothetical protein MIND_01042600 [Mycena indigotica]